MARESDMGEWEGARNFLEAGRIHRISSHKSFLARRSQYKSAKRVVETIRKLQMVQTLSVQEPTKIFRAGKMRVRRKN